MQEQSSPACNFGVTGEKAPQGLGRGRAYMDQSRKPGASTLLGFVSKPRGQPSMKSGRTAAIPEFDGED